MNQLEDFIASHETRQSLARDVLRKILQLLVVGTNAFSEVVLDCRPLRLTCGREPLHRGFHIAAMLLANLFELCPLRLGEIQLTERNS